MDCERCGRDAKKTGVQVTGDGHGGTLCGSCFEGFKAFMAGHSSLSRFIPHERAAEQRYIETITDTDEPGKGDAGE